MSAILVPPASLPSKASNAPASSQNGIPGQAEANGTDASGPSSFGALIQQLLGKAPATDSGLEVLLAPTPAAQDTTEEASTELDAMLPFLEAMGLAQAAAPADPVAAPITPPVTMNSAAITAGEPAQGGSASPLAGTFSANTPAVAAAETQTQQRSHSDPDSDNDTAAGREFAAKLTTAIEGSKQPEQTPGSTANAVQQVMANQPAATRSASQHTITEPVGTANWSGEVGQKVVWMANRSEGRAELVLTPPQMGRVEVSVSVSGDQATASFASANPVVREALEAALPRLREIFAEAGIQLGQAQVGAENARQSDSQDKNADNFASTRDLASRTGPGATTNNADASAQGLKVGRGLVDVFA